HWMPGACPLTAGPAAMAHLESSPPRTGFHHSSAGSWIEVLNRVEPYAFATIVSMELSAHILGEIDRRFPEADRDGARSLLTSCESEQVCISILRLSRGKVKRVEELVEAARRDYRDVIAWASQPTRTYIAGLLRKGPNWTDADEGGRTHLGTK